MGSAKRKVKIVEDQWFCEPVLWISWVHRGQMRTLCVSEVLALDAQGFRSVTTVHPDAFVFCRNYARDAVESMNRTLEDGLRTWDISNELIYSTDSTDSPSYLEMVDIDAAEDFDMLLDDCSSDSDEGDLADAIAFDAGARSCRTVTDSVARSTETDVPESRRSSKCCPPHERRLPETL